MRNLADNDDCDRYIRVELKRARIDIVEGERSLHEVPASVTGRIGEFTFARAWYYWVAHGPMPIDKARELYQDPIGKTDIRAGGHCGCPPPEEYGADYYAADGRELVSDPEGKEFASFERFIKQGFLAADVLSKYRFVPDKRAPGAAARVVVNCYHIDSEAGLRIFADAVRSLGSTL